mgnify:CR=1 FL=1|jgi:hypothetical protein
MNITAEISLYALDAAYKDRVIGFLEDLRREPGIEVLTNQMSTQLRGEFDAVTGGVNRAMYRSMKDGEATLAFVVKYLSSDLPIGEPPKLDRDDG